MGKSRLVREVAASAEDSGLQVLTGRAVPSGEPYRPLVEAMSAALRDRPMPDDDTLRPYLPVLAAVLPDAEVTGQRIDPRGGVVLGEAVLRLVAALADGARHRAGAGGPALGRPGHAHRADLPGARRRVDAAAAADHQPGGGRPAGAADGAGRRLPGDGAAAGAGWTPTTSARWSSPAWPAGRRTRWSRSRWTTPTGCRCWSRSCSPGWAASARSPRPAGWSARSPPACRAPSRRPCCAGSPTWTRPPGRWCRPPRCWAGGSTGRCCRR